MIKRLYGIIGQRLRQARRAKDISQDAVAECLQIGRSSVANFERGRQKFPVHQLYAFADFVGIPVEDVFPRANELRADGSQALEEVVVGEDRRMLPDYQAAFVREALGRGEG